MASVGRAASLFSGVGGLDLGVERAGFEIVFQCEWDAYRREVLARHWPDVPVYEDVREVGPSAPGDLDLLFGGFPCQDLSVAGRRRGLAGERSSLFFEFARIADELVRPGGFVLVENVPGLLSGCSCVGCEECRDLLRLHSRGWRHVGRDAGRGSGGLRFDLGDPDGGAVDGGDGDPRRGGGRCPCRRCDEARRLIAEHDGTEFAVVRSVLGAVGFHDLAWRVLDSRYFGVPQRRQRVFILGRRAGGRRAAEVLLEPEGGGGDFAAGEEAGARSAAGAGISPSITRRYGKGPDSDATDTFVNALDRKGGGADDNDARGGHLVAHTLTSEGFDASEDGTGRGTPLVAGTVRSHVRPGSNDEGGIVVNALTGHDRGGRNDANEPFVLAPEVAAPLTKGSATGDGVSVPGRRQEDDFNLVGREEADADRVREAPGLPGRMDGPLTCVFDPLPDGRRYAAMGDAVTVNVAEWIGRRLAG